MVKCDNCNHKEVCKNYPTKTIPALTRQAMLKGLSKICKHFQAVSQWIPVVERLPEVMESVLISATNPETNEHKVCSAVIFFSNDEKISQCNNEWCSSYDDNMFNPIFYNKEYITAWQPLPNPYKPIRSEHPEPISGGVAKEDIASAVEEEKEFYSDLRVLAQHQTCGDYKEQRNTMLKKSCPPYLSMQHGTIATICCPNCGKGIYVDHNVPENEKEIVWDEEETNKRYCEWCGQEFDWTDKKESMEL